MDNFSTEHINETPNNLTGQTPAGTDAVSSQPLTLTRQNTPPDTHGQQEATQPQSIQGNFIKKRRLPRQVFWGTVVFGITLIIIGVALMFFAK